jgi:hypothetical protein
MALVGSTCTSNYCAITKILGDPSRGQPERPNKSAPGYRSMCIISSVSAITVSDFHVFHIVTDSSSKLEDTMMVWPGEVDAERRLDVA